MRIVKFRNELGLSQEQLAFKVGLNQSDISKLESGRRDPLSLDLRTAMKFAQVLGHTLEEVFGKP